jgi:hypothetical protein
MTVPIEEDPPRMRPDLRLRTRVSLVVVAGALLVAIGVTLLLINTIKLRNDAPATIRYDNDFDAVVNVERLVVDAETGLRGYVITGHPLFLQPLRSAQAEMPRALAVLSQTAGRDRSFTEQVNGLAQAARSYMSGYVPRMVSMAAHDLRTARTLAVTLEGKRLVDVGRRRAPVPQRRDAAPGSGGPLHHGCLHAVDRRG